ncbi:MAG: ABC transporter substrate-binding protein [Gemmatimonadaceae bacterium]
MFSVRHLRTLVFLAILAPACSGPDRAAVNAPAVTGVDDFGDTLRLAAPPARIVSLNPVITEALFAIGAGARVTGRTHWDTHPAAAQAVPDLGDGMQPNVEAVLATRPDLVVLYASNGNRAAASAFRRAGVATLALHTDVRADLWKALAWLGRVTGDSAQARVVADSVQASLDAVQRAAQRAVRAGAAPSVFWNVWDAPVITIGAGSYLDELVRTAGARNVFGDVAQPSPQVTLESVAQRNPDFILAGPVSAARLRTDARWRSVAAVRNGRVLVVDTTLVGRPGVRMGEAARHLHVLIDSAVRAEHAERAVNVPREVRP